MLHPLKFKPILKQTIWGGNKLAYKSDNQDIKDKIGESWEISGVEDNISVVSEGLLEENNLQELIEVYMGDLIGDKVYEKFSTEFPLLIKYIDACDNLSIQVHPDDKTAMERHHAYGKTEMWYVQEAEEGAQLIVGFNKEYEKSEYLQRLENNTLEVIMNYIPVKKGDCVFIPAGTIHAICKGCLIVEIQQTSDITYRIYDYNRKDANGNARELHTEYAKDVIDFTYEQKRLINYKQHINHRERLVKCEYFTTNILEFDKELEQDYIRIDSFVIYICLEGNFTLVYDTDKFVKVQQGESILLPACFKNVFLIPEKGNKAKIIETYIE